MLASQHIKKQCVNHKATKSKNRTTALERSVEWTTGGGGGGGEGFKALLQLGNPFSKRWQLSYPHLAKYIFNLHNS